MEDPRSSKLSQLHIQPQYCSRAFVTNMLTSWAELGIRDQRASFCLGISLLRSLHVNGIHGKARGKVMLICQVSWYPRIHCATQSWAEVAITVSLDSNYPTRATIKSIQTAGYNSTHTVTWFTVRLEEEKWGWDFWYPAHKAGLVVTGSLNSEYCTHTIIIPSEFKTTLVMKLHILVPKVE
mgnify:CR=1 FL=1